MRKKYILFLFVLLFPFALLAEKQGYSIKVKFKQLKDTICYLGNYYGDKQYIKDTAKVDSKGNCEFTGKENLPGGIYLVIIPSKRYFEIIVDKEQFFTAETDTIDFIGNMKIKGSTDNQLFYDYLKFINDEQKKVEPLRTALTRVNKDKDSTKFYQNKLNAIDSIVKKYKLDYMANNPKSFLTEVFKASYDPDLPEAPLLPNGKKDSNFVFRYYKQHFLDNIDFNDERILRTPVFHNKIKQYITTLITPQPDSLIKEIDSLISRARVNKEMFKYLVWYFTSWSETSNVMGYDAIFVHMVQKYYNSNEAYWVTPSNLKKLTDRANILKNLLIGVKIPNITAQDTNGVNVSLYDVNTKYTVLYIWDPTCGHCQKETPILKSLYDSLKTLKKSIEVYALCADENLIKEWKKYIREHHLNWINVVDMYNTTNFHATYDIFSTPVIYLLDGNKLILAKRISVEQLKDFLDWQFKKDDKAKDKK